MIDSYCANALEYSSDSTHFSAQSLTLVIILLVLTLTGILKPVGMTVVSPVLLE